MNVSKNVVFLRGIQDNKRAKAEETKEGTRKKQPENTALFAGRMNEDLFSNKILEKKKEAQKKAMQVVGDAWKGERKIDEDLQERRDLINALEGENGEALSEINEINQRQEELKKQYGITKDSKEEKDLELLRREKQMWTNPGAGESLTMEEMRYVQKLRSEGLTDYQKRQLSLDAEKHHFQDIVDENKKEIVEENAIIRGVRLERLKSDPMLKAQEEAEEIKKAAIDEIVGMLIEEAKENIDEESEENRQKAEKLEEEQKKMEEFIEAQKEKRKETDNLLEEMPVEELIGMEQLKEEVKQEVQKIVDNMNLVVEDIKGAMVDKTL